MLPQEWKLKATHQAFLNNYIGSLGRVYPWMFAMEYFLKCLIVKLEILSKRWCLRDDCFIFMSCMNIPSVCWIIEIVLLAIILRGENDDTNSMVVTFSFNWFPPTLLLFVCIYFFVFGNVLICADRHCFDKGHFFLRIILRVRLHLAIGIVHNLPFCLYFVLAVYIYFTEIIQEFLLKNMLSTFC